VKNIRRKPVDFKTLRLSPEEGFVLSRLDAPLSVRELVSLTGLDEARVVTIVEGLASQGALDMDRDGGPSTSPATAVTQPPVPFSIPPAESASKPPVATESERELAEAEAAADAANAEPPPHEPGEGDETAEDAQKREVGEREYRRIYQEQFASLDREARIHAAETVGNPELFALCYDPEPQVIHALVKNTKCGLEHARMIALHHRTHLGLDAIGRRSDYLSDAQVQKRLMKNPQIPDAMLRRIVSPKLIMDVYKIAIDRENPEMARMKVRELLIKKFSLASSDERAALVIKTDARCLTLLVNCALDARATQILCGRQSYTILFIQNVARWPASPPALLTHLLKLGVVRNNMGLRKMILKHPNVPVETKRNLS
jgi:hypothetical protein